MPEPSLKDQEAAVRIDIDRKQARAGAAAGLLDNELLQEALKAQRDGCLRLIENSEPGAREEREWLYQQLQAGKVFRQYLQTTLDSGKIADVTAARMLDGSTGRTE